jgi:hypothetical protein
MGNNLSLIHLPAQSGKTRKMTDLINKWKGIIKLQGLEHNLNIIFTSNTKLLAKQTKNRVVEHVDNAELSLSREEEFSDNISEITDDNITVSSLGCDNDDYDETGSRTLAWVHETKKGAKGKSKDVNALSTEIGLEDLYDNIICCSNATRVKRVFELLTKLNKAHKSGRFPKRISIWIDEADACMNIWKKYIGKYPEFGSFIESIVMITATMLPVYKYMASNQIDCNLRVYQSTHLPMYHKYSESNICHEYSEHAGVAVEFITRILDSVEIPQTSKWFCPGNKQKSSHEEVCSILLLKGFNVLILNGDKKEIRYSDGRPPTQIMERLEDDLEIAKTLNYIYYSNHLFNQPFAVTGNLCIGRGITFVSHEPLGEFIFTHGIIPDISNGEEAYQLVSRCLGNIKGFDTYSPPCIFISPKMNVKILEQERFAIELAAKFYTENEEIVTITPTQINEFIGREIISANDETGGRKKRGENSQEGAIPVKLIMNTESVFQELIEKRSQPKYKVKMDIFIKESIGNGRISVVDNNSEQNRFINSSNEISRTLKTIRMYEAGQDTKNRRFKNFSEALEEGKQISQTCAAGDYNLDFAKDDYVHERNGFTNIHTVAWITYTKMI